MKLTIKVLKGQDCTLDVDASHTIQEVKQQIEQKLGIATTEQKLILLGRTLNNENTLASYPNIRDGSKLNLVVMPQRQEGLRKGIYRAFCKYFNEQQSEKLTTEFMAEFETRMRELSLDDIERLSEALTDQMACV